MTGGSDWTAAARRVLRRLPEDARVVDRPGAWHPASFDSSPSWHEVRSTDPDVLMETMGSR